MNPTKETLTQILDFCRLIKLHFEDQEKRILALEEAFRGDEALHKLHSQAVERTKKRVPSPGPDTVLRAARSALAKIPDR